MVKLSKISFSTISYVTEDIYLVTQSVKQCLPENLREYKFKFTKMQSQFGDKIVMISGEFKNQIATSIIEYLASKISEKDKLFLGTKVNERVDTDDRIFHIRLNKFLPLSNQITIGEGSDVIKVEIKYQVFTSDQNNLENVRNCLLEEGIILE